MYRLNFNFKNVAHVVKYSLLPMLLIFFLVFSACNEEPVEEPEKKSDLKEMTDVEISAGDHKFSVAKQSDEKTFKFTVPLGFDLQLLSKTKVVFKLSEGALSNRLSGSEINFTSVESIDITVTAEDKTTKVYTIEKEVELSSDAKILAFALNIGTEKFEGVVNDTDGKVTLTVPYLLKEGLKTAIPLFFISPSASVNFASGVARDFSNPVLYEVTSQDNTKRTWEVIVTLGPASAENDILSFNFKIGNEELKGVINKTNHTVSIFVPDVYYDVYKTGIPTIEVSEYATFTPALGDVLAFEGAAPYTFIYNVTAQDGVTRQWSVIITLEDGCLINPYPGCPNYDDSTPVLANTMTIGTTAYEIIEKVVENVDEGIWYMKTTITNPAKPLVIHTVRFDPSARGYSLETWVGNDSVTGRNSPSAMVNRYANATPSRDVMMSINGGFYGTETWSTPISLQQTNGVITFLPQRQLPIIGFDARNVPYIDSVRFNASMRIVKNNTTRAFNSLNASHPDENMRSGRWPDYLVLYNTYKGKRTYTNQWGVEILCTPVNGQWESQSSYTNVRCRVEKITRVGEAANMEIPKGSIVISGHGVAGTYLNALNVNDFVDVTLNYHLVNEPSITSRTIRNAVNGWNIILTNNVIQEYFIWGGDTYVEPQNHPRTAVGYDNDKKYIYFTVVEGRNPSAANPTISAGVNTKELAQVMQYFGATNAINLDGGGSSCMMLDKQMKNLVDGGTWQRSVADGLAIIRR